MPQVASLWSMSEDYSEFEIDYMEVF